MALDATVGGVSANSFLTVSRANLLVQEGRVDDSEWSDAGESKRAAALVEATQLLSASFEWNGSRTDSTQALPWPRKSVVVDGVTVDSSTIPRAIEEAVLDIAFRALKNSDTQSGELQTLGLAALQVDVIKLEAQDAPVKVDAIPDRLQFLLSGYGINLSQQGVACQGRMRRA